MEYSEIKKIMKDMEDSKLAELSIEFPDGTKVSLKNETKENVKIAKELNRLQDVSQEQSVLNEKKEQEALNKDTGIDTEDSTQNIVKSPMVGTFYAKPSPNAENYVEVGKHVKKGDILCIIEAMKLMNEIESEYDGEIVKILVQDGDGVDYGKPLFIIK